MADKQKIEALLGQIKTAEHNVEIREREENAARKDFEQTPGGDTFTDLGKAEGASLEARDELRDLERELLELEQSSDENGEDAE